LDVVLQKQKLPPGIINNGRIKDKKSLKDILSNIYIKYNLRKTQVNVVINSKEVITRLIEVPKKAEAKLKSAVHCEAKYLLSHSYKDNAVDFVNLGSFNNNNMLNILIAAVPKDIVYDYIKVFREVNIKINAVDIKSMALKKWLYNIGKHNWPDAEFTNISIINLGDEIADFNIFQKGQLVFTRQLNFKCSNFINDTAVMEFNHKNVFHDLLIEVKNTLEYSRSKLHLEPIAKFIFTGSLSKTPNIKEEFSKEFNLPVEIGELKLPEYGIEVSPEMAVAVGLGLRTCTYE
jgi:type IV pilus assembly protein PilM